MVKRGFLFLLSTFGCYVLWISQTMLMLISLSSSVLCIVFFFLLMFTLAITDQAYSRFLPSNWVWRTLWSSRPPPPPTCSPPPPPPPTLAAPLLLSLSSQLLPYPSPPTLMTTPPSLKHSTTPLCPTCKWRTSRKPNRVQKSVQKLLFTQMPRLPRQYLAYSGITKIFQV